MLIAQTARDLVLGVVTFFVIYNRQDTVKVFIAFFIQRIRLCPSVCECVSLSEITQRISLNLF